jgi:hypothetical protein
MLLDKKIQFFYYPEYSDETETTIDIQHETLKKQPA